MANPITVTIYEVDQRTGELTTVIHVGPWTEIADVNELTPAERDEFSRHGRVKVGGGAAAMALIVRN